MAERLTRAEQQALFRAADIVMEYAVCAWEAVQAAGGVVMACKLGEDATTLFGVELCRVTSYTRSCERLYTREQSRDLLIAIAVMGGPDNV